jgi:uncharacterized protein YdeI (YjbR/CyaY-like superfamily)
MPHTDLAILSFVTQTDLKAHMSALKRASEGFWIKLSKQGAPAKTVSKEDAIESAICCGWIDGQLRASDEHFYLIRMTPRRPRSRWSAKNRGTAERLAELGRLMPEGQREIRDAKKDGRWESAYQSQGKTEPPADFMLALEQNKAAEDFFEILDRANRFAMIYSVNDAKRPETRAKRIADFVEMLARGEALHPIKKGRDQAR